MCSATRGCSRRTSATCLERGQRGQGRDDKATAEHAETAEQLPYVVSGLSRTREDNGGEKATAARAETAEQLPYVVSGFTRTREDNGGEKATAARAETAEQLPYVVSG